METVLVVGSTGNIGVAAVLGALRAKCSVPAIVRNQMSADKLFQHAKSKENITVVVADITSETGVQGVVDQVRAGKLPAFQHVYSAGMRYLNIYELAFARLFRTLTMNFVCGSRWSILCDPPDRPYPQQHTAIHGHQL